MILVCSTTISIETDFVSALAFGNQTMTDSYNLRWCDKRWTKWKFWKCLESPWSRRHRIMNINFFALKIRKKCSKMKRTEETERQSAEALNSLFDDFWKIINEFMNLLNIFNERFFALNKNHLANGENNFQFSSFLPSLAWSFLCHFCLSRSRPFVSVVSWRIETEREN